MSELHGRGLLRSADTHLNDTFRRKPAKEERWACCNCEIRYSASRTERTVDNQRKATKARLASQVHGRAAAATCEAEVGAVSDQKSCKRRRVLRRSVTTTHITRLPKDRNTDCKNHGKKLGNYLESVRGPGDGGR